ncbi:hypothetical protein [Paenochrobactrum pullorum]|uniref:hypothetical protein n=1 Tax=Paenochrobactrum pullorum TaxID=1324351 RepID=UPI0035BC8396
MSIFTKLGVSVAAPFNADGTPRQISPQDFQIWMTEVERLIKGLLAGAGGIDLPDLIYKYWINGGNENNIIAQPSATPPTAAGEALFTIEITLPNTGNVTINGKPLLTSSGNQIVAGGLVSGIWLFLDDGENFRLVSDQASQAIIDAAERAAQAAQEARDIVKNLASDTVSQGNVPIYSTLTAIASVEIPAGINAIRVNGRNTVGDGEGGLYVIQDNGSSDTGYSGGATARIWYRVKDVGEERLNITYLRPIKSAYEVTVGVGGDFTSINSALMHLTQSYPTYLFDGFDATIKLKSGFVMDEQVIVKNGVKLGWVTLRSEDEGVIINRSSLTFSPYVIDQTKNQGSPRILFPAFAAIKNSELPTIGCAFIMDKSGASPSRGGFLGAEGSILNILEGCGITEASGNGIELYMSTLFAHKAVVTKSASSNVFCNSASDMDLSFGVFDDADINNVYIHRSGRASLRGISAQNAGDCGLKIHHGGLADTTYANFSGAKGDAGVYIRHAGVVDADTMVVNDCVNKGVYCHFGGNVDLATSEIKRNGIGVLCEQGGKVNIGDGAVAHSRTHNVWSTSGGDISLVNSDVTYAGQDALRCSGGSRISANSVDAQSAGSFGVNALSAGEVGAYSIRLTTGKETNIPFNTPSANGARIWGGRAS